MTLNPAHIVVPYTEFLERRERRCRIASEIKREQEEHTIDVEAIDVEAVAVARPKPSAPTQELHDDDPAGVTHRGRA